MGDESIEVRKMSKKVTAKWGYEDNVNMKIELKGPWWLPDLPDEEIEPEDLPSIWEVFRDYENSLNKEENGSSHPIPVERHTESRGKLYFPPELPFIPSRMFWITRVPKDYVRADHAHRKCRQLILVAGGNIRMRTENCAGEKTTKKLKEGDAICIEPMTWVVLDSFSQHATVVVLCSHPYDKDDYIREPEKFQSECHES